MTRAWTSQELLAPKVSQFYTRDWRPYLGDTRLNYKESLEIMQELANVIGVTGETIIAFNLDDLGIRDKLCMALSCNAMVVDNIAYSFSRAISGWSMEKDTLRLATCWRRWLLIQEK